MSYYWKNEEQIDFWHKKLGHINMKTIHKLLKFWLVRELLKFVNIEDFTCESCIKGKQTREHFKTKEHISLSRPLDLICLYLFGLSKIARFFG